jgi:hypothetical protein
MTGVVTQIVKVRPSSLACPRLMIQMMVGRPRPDLIDRCRPPIGSTDHALYGLSTIDICTNTNQAQLDDGFKVSNILIPSPFADKAEFPKRT